RGRSTVSSRRGNEAEKTNLRKPASSRRRLRSRQNFLHHTTINVRQPKVATGISIGELLVVEAEQVQNGRVQIVDVYFVLDRFEPEFIRRAINCAAIHA